MPKSNAWSAIMSLKLLRGFTMPVSRILAQSDDSIPSAGQSPLNEGKR